MKTWRGYNILDVFLIGVGLIATNLIAILFHSDVWITIYTNLALLCVFTQAKGKVSTLFFGIVSFIIYIFISYQQGFYGEVIMYSLILIPLYLYGLFQWFANMDKKENVVLVRDNLSKKEWLISSVAFIFVGVGVYFLLKALNTSQLVISTLTFMSLVPCIYLLVRRCKWNQLAFFINDFITPLLWLVLVIQGNLMFLPICLNNVFQLVYDIYGMLTWAKLEKQQSLSKKE